VSFNVSSRIQELQSSISFSIDSDLDAQYSAVNGVCQYCETSGLCCDNSQTQLAPLRSASDRFKRLFTERDQESRHFRLHTRAYNSIHAFMSTGVKVHDRLQGNGVSIYKVPNMALGSGRPAQSWPKCELSRRGEGV
jgi:hypothetical protein